MLRLRPPLLGLLIALACAGPASAAPASFGVDQSPTNVVKGTVVTFTASGSTGDFRWDADGNETFTQSFAGPKLTWTAPGPGKYLIWARAVDASYTGDASVGGYYDNRFDVTVRNQDPTASFTFSPVSPFSGDTVTFDASASTDLDGAPIAKYEWDLDGAPGVDVTTTTPTVTHSYPFAGYLDVALRVTDANGGTGTAVKRVTLADTGDGSGTDGGGGTGEEDESGDVGIDVGNVTPVKARFSVAVDARGAFSRVRTLRVRGLPKAGRVRATCKGKGCPWRKRSFKVRSGQANLGPSLRNANLRTGVVITVFATAGERLGKVARVTVTGPGLSKLELLCVRPGSSKIRRCT
jgi:PKD domain